MVFLLDDDILDAIENNNLSLEELGAIQKIAQSYLDGIHIVYASPKLIIRLSKLATLSSTQRYAFEILSNNLVMLDTWETVPYQIVVKHQTKFFRIYENGITRFNVSLKYINKTQITQKPCLISESMKDCKYYLNMAYSLKGIVPVFKYSNIQLRKAPGGGNDTGIVLENEVDEGCICIVIADSDRKYPGCNDGGTLREVKKVINKLEGSIEAIYVIKNLMVREKENLVPPHLYRLTTRAKDYNAILDDLTYIYENISTREIYFYMDLKDGQKSDNFLECLRTQELYEKLYKEEACACFKEIPCSFSEMKQKAEQNEKLFCGIGELIDIFELDVFNGGLSSEIANKKKLIDNGIDIPSRVINDLMEKEEKSKDVYSQLCDTLLSEWQDIVVKVAAIGCSPLNRLI